MKGAVPRGDGTGPSQRYKCEGPVSPASCPQEDTTVFQQRGEHEMDFCRRSACFQYTQESVFKRSFKTCYVRKAKKVIFSKTDSHGLAFLCRLRFSYMLGLLEEGTHCPRGREQ